MRKKTLRSFDNYETACKEICKIYESSEDMRSQLASIAREFPEDQFIKELYKEFVYLCENAKSVKYKLLSSGKVPYRASKRMVESASRTKLILDRYNIRIQRSET